MDAENIMKKNKKAIVESNRRASKCFESFMNFLNDNGVHQILNSPTSDSNFLSQFMTNDPTLVNRCEVIPGLSYHGAVHVIMNIELPRRKPVKKRCICRPRLTKK